MAEEHEAGIRLLARDIAALAADCQADQATAAGVIAIAGRAAARGEDGAAAEAAEARRVMADCNAALETLAALTPVLARAAVALAAAPGDYAERYETVLAFTGADGILPRRGDFLAAAG